MTRSRSRPRAVPPLDPEGLERLALRYVERFATSRGKLADYLARKLRERGWAEGAPAADPAALAERMAALGYVDDAGFAAMKARGLSPRGYGARRLEAALGAAHIDEDDRAEARALHADEAEAAAHRFARRRRLGPYGPPPADPRARERAVAAMLRAGHPMALVRRVLGGSGDLPDEE